MAETDLERLVVTLEARMGSFEKEMKRASGIYDRESRSIERRQSQLTKKLQAGAVNIGRNLLPSIGGIATALSAREIIQYADSWTSAGNKVVASGTALDQQGTRLRQLADLAVSTRTAFDPTIDLFSRLQRATQSLGLSQAQLLRYTETINKSFVVGGAAASEQAAGILQLSQAISSGRLAGDELRSVGENAPLIARAIADALGVSIGKMKTLGAEGKITVDVIMRALDRLGPQVDATFGKTKETVGQALQNLETRFTEFVGGLSENGAMEVLADGINGVASNIDKLAVAAGIAAAALAPAGLALAATLATRAIGGLTAAMLANPLGVLATLMAAVSSATYLYVKHAREAAVKQEDFNASLRVAKELEQQVRDGRVALKQATADAAIATLEAAKAEDERSAALLRAQALDLEILKQRQKGANPQTGMEEQLLLKQIALLEERIRKADESLKSLKGNLSKTVDYKAPTAIPKPAAEPDDAAIKKAKADAKVISDLQRDIETYGNKRQQAVDNAVNRLSDAASPETRKRVEDLAGALYDLGDPTKLATEQLGLENGQLERLIAAYGQSKQAIQDVTDAIERENAAREKGINLSTPEGKAWEDRIKRNQQLKHELDKQQEEARSGIDVAKELGMAFNSAFEDATVSGGTLGDVFKGLEQDILRLIMRAYVLKAIMQTIGLNADGTSTGGGLLSFLGNIFKFAGGGVMTPQGPRMLPRYASGGVAGSAAIFGEAGPEAAVPLPDGRRIPVDLRVPSVSTRQSSGVQMQIINNAPVDIQTEKTQRGANGDDMVRLVINEVRNDFARGGFDKPQAARFGTRPRRVNR